MTVYILYVVRADENPDKYPWKFIVMMVGQIAPVDGTGKLFSI